MVEVAGPSRQAAGPINGNNPIDTLEIVNSFD
jgi:hypothetical protein